MAGVPKPVVDPRFGPAWTPIIQGQQSQKQQAAALNSGATQGNLLDQWGNTIQVSGSNLNQIVTIGASHGISGVQVGTGIQSGTAGLAVQSGPAITTITLTAGSTAATVGTVTGASLAVGQVIGAANVSDPSSGTPTPALTPGTTIATLSGSSVTLSQPAAESGTALYCAASRFILQQDTGWQLLTLGSGLTSFSFTPSARLIGDIVHLKGGIDGAWSSGQTLATLPTAMHPQGGVPEITLNVWTGTAFIGQTLNISSAGQMSVLTAQTTGSFNLDGLAFSIY